MTREEEIIDSYMEPPELSETTTEDELLEYYEDVKGAD